MSDTLILKWIQVEWCTQFKILNVMRTYNALHGQAPRYICNKLQKKKSGITAWILSPKCNSVNF